MIYEDIQLAEICRRAENLTETKYPDGNLLPIFGAGQIKSPKIAFVFINPTHKNASSSREWRGLRAPWIGVRNIWRMFVEAGAITPKVFERTQIKENWKEDFALRHYRDIAENGFYITNLVKWTGANAKLPGSEMIKPYMDILKDELRALSPQYTIAFGQLTFSSLVPSMRKERFSDLVLGSSFDSYDSEDFKHVVPSYFPVGQGIKNWGKAVQTVKEVLKAVA